jgi:hypothetical protein
MAHNKNLDPWNLLPKTTRSIKSVGTWHAHVQQHHIRTQFAAFWRVSLAFDASPQTSEGFSLDSKPTSPRRIS